MALVVTSIDNLDAFPVGHGQQFIINNQTFTILRSPRYTGNLTKIHAAVLEDLKIDTSTTSGCIYAYGTPCVFGSEEFQAIEEDPFLIYTKQVFSGKKQDIFFFTRNVCDFIRFVKEQLNLI